MIFEKLGIQKHPNQNVPIEREYSRKHGCYSIGNVSFNKFEEHLPQNCTYLEYIIFNITLI